MMKIAIASSCLVIMAGMAAADEKVASSPFKKAATWSAASGPLVVDLAGRWRFAMDPDDSGEKQGWQKAEFDDAKWEWIETGKSWQEQGRDFGGYAWYRAQVYIPKECAGIPLELNLGDIREDDDVFLNGVRIGGLRGAYKYENLISRSYTALPEEVRYGAENTIAIRVWGGREGIFRSESGLIAKKPRAVLNPDRLWAARPGDKAVPLERFDISDAQHSLAFELIFSMPGDPATVEFTLGDIAEDFSAKAAKPSFDFRLFPPGQPMPPFASGKARARGEGKWTVEIPADVARKIYLNGRLQLNTVARDAAGREIHASRLTSDRLDFSGRDRRELAALETPPQHETPFGKLTLIDEIDAASSLEDEEHPYQQGGFEEPRFRKTPGSPVTVEKSSILGREARESGLGWFAYRIGRGKLVPGQAYLLRIEYPEDKPRYFPIHLETGLEYSGIGWTSGVSPDNPYNNWPLSGAWQWHDAVVIAGERTLGSGGAESAPGKFGFWVYFLNKTAADRYYTMYQGGPAVGRIRLYALDEDKHAPRLTLPAGLPQRTLMVDWERQPLQAPENFVRYARLMGYNAISPLLLKWGFTSFGESMPGYDSAGADAEGYYVKSSYAQGSGKAPGPAVPGLPSVHRQYLDATRQSGLRYLPRIEYGGSMDLPESARAMAPDGKVMPTSRYIPWGANLLDEATFEDLKKLLETQIAPFVADNPQLGGILWRIRCDRMLPSFGKPDLELFAKETGTPLPPGSVSEQGTWARTGDGAAAYRAWWFKKRAAFHSRVRDLLATYRPDLEFLYYNWDSDKWSLGIPDFHSGAFYRKLLDSPNGGNAVYAEDAADRRKLTGSDYVEMIRSGQLYPAPPVMNWDRALDMSFYRDAGNLRLFGPANYLFFANDPEYLRYFGEGPSLAISHAVAFDELGYKSINPKYECNMPIPGGGNFSMALEVLAYFHGDAHTLTWTTYTYGRSFAAEHRRFAQAFLALPAVPGTIVEQGDENVRVRTYPAAKGTYVGVASKDYASKKMTVKIPAGANGEVVNLVTNEIVPSRFAKGELSFEVSSGPMELNAYFIR